MKLRPIIISMVFLLAIAAAAYAAPDPEGAAVIVGTPETRNGSTAVPGNVTADGGNITNVNLSAESTTTSWQGFFGEISDDSNLTLEDFSGDTMFTWNLSGITFTGEVYASRNATIDFTTVSGVTNCTIDETLTGTGADRTNRTFFNNTVGFTIGTVGITEACRTFTYVNSAPQSTNFEEIIVNATGVPSIYVTEINVDTTGFDGNTHDYQMIVPDFSNSTTTTYFFFVELT